MVIVAKEVIVLLEELIFEGGKRPNASPLTHVVPRVTVLVGPNSSGKSETLKQIDAFASSGRQPEMVLQSVGATIPESVEDAVSDIPSDLLTETENPQGNVVYRVNQRSFGKGRSDSKSVPRNRLHTALEQQDLSQLAPFLLGPLTIRLDGRTRFELVKTSQLQSLRNEPQNHLSALFADPEAREEVRRLTEEAFGLHFVLDPLDVPHISIRLSEERPPRSVRKAVIDRDARGYLDGGRKISEVGDGAQAYVGILTALLSLPHRLVLLDEPEAFLHPPLVRRLGSEVSRIAQEASGQLIVATHSPDFLLGCLTTTTDVAVIRLTYESSTGTARALNADDIRAFLNDPLLRSAGIAQGLFHHSAIVAEADTDRAFYGEINRRLLASDRGIEDAVFLNAQNWQTISRIVDALRQAGVAAVGIMDADVLLTNASEQKKIASAFQIPANYRTQFHARWDKVKNILAGRRENLKENGLSATPKSGRSFVNSFVDYLARYGLFIVPVGEVECWLSSLKVGGVKKRWLERVFQAIGTFEDDSAYLAPQHDDVWKFLDDISEWTADPNRDGV